MARHDLLAGPGLAGDQDVRLARGDAGDLGPERSRARIGEEWSFLNAGEFDPRLPGRPRARHPRPGLVSDAGVPRCQTHAPLLFRHRATIAAARTARAAGLLPFFRLSE